MVDPPNLTVVFTQICTSIFRQHIYTANLPEVHRVIRRMRALLDEYDDRIMVGEICLSNEQLMTYYGQAYDECHLPFNFQLILTPWEAEAVHKAMDAYEKSLREKGWPNWVLGNHDEQWDASPNAGFAETAVQTWLPFAHDYAQVNVATQSDDPDSMLLLSDAGRVAGVRTSAHGGRLHVR